MVANAITLSRLGLLGVAVTLLYVEGPAPKVVAFLLTLLIIAMDGIDGMVARARGEESDLGAVMDIAIDRVVENVYWIVFADLALVPIWIALVVVSRGIITDAIRGYVLAKGHTAFDMMRGRVARWLVSGRPMRAFYGALKAAAFAALVLFLALRDLFPDATWMEPLQLGLNVLVLITVATTVLRGVPVVFESRRYFFSEPVA